MVARLGAPAVGGTTTKLSIASNTFPSALFKAFFASSSEHPVM